MLITGNNLIDVAAGDASHGLLSNVIYHREVYNFTHFPRRIRVHLAGDFLPSGEIISVTLY